MKWFRRKEVKSAPKRLVFVHVPRTGGTNFWYSCAYSWARNKTIGFLDVYHESLTRFGSINHASEVLSILTNPLATDRRDMMLHHHNGFGIWRLLGTDFDYCTLLRDPVERYTSWYFHSLQRYYDIDWNAMTYRMKAEMREQTTTAGKVLGIMAGHADGPLPRIPNLATTLMPDEPGDLLMRMDSFSVFLQLEALGLDLLSSKALTRYLALTPPLHNFYCRMFCLYFCVEKEIPDGLLPPMAIDAEFAGHIALLAKRHFHGICFSVDQALAYAEQYFGRPLVERDKMPYAARRPAWDDSDALKAELRAAFTWDYALLASLQ